jgi:signal peptidase I
MTQKRREDLGKMGISQVDGNVAEAKERMLMQPWWLDWTAGLFPVIIAGVFVALVSWSRSKFLRVP